MSTRPAIARLKVTLEDVAPAVMRRLDVPLTIRLDRLELGIPELRDRYCRDVITALAVPATPGRHANVLQHMAGYFSQQLDDGDRGELLDLIEDHRLGRAPLAAPLALVRHHVRRMRIEWLLAQVYLYGPTRPLRLSDD